MMMYGTRDISKIAEEISRMLLGSVTDQPRLESTRFRIPGLSTFALPDHETRGHVPEIRVGATCKMFITVPDGAATREKDEKPGISIWSF